MMVAYDQDGNLAPGVHWLTWSEFVEMFSWNDERRRLIDGLKVALDALRSVGCMTIYVDDSFVTTKSDPADFDACWDRAGVDMRKLPFALLTFDDERAVQKGAYGGELFPADLVADSAGTRFIDFFTKRPSYRKAEGNRRPQFEGVAMIKNERQRQITEEEIGKFEDAIACLPDLATIDNENDRLFWQVQNDALNSMLNDLRRQLADYEQLRAGQLRTVTFDSFPQLADALIAARIAAGLTQRQLAERLGLKEQQIQRYEATDYQSASLARIAQVASALRIDVRAEISLPGAA